MATSSGSLRVSSSSGIVLNGTTDTVHGVLPEAYLKSGIYLGEGDGSKDNPYTIAPNDETQLGGNSGDSPELEKPPAPVP